MTAAATTGPAQGPRPASSMPHTHEKPLGSCAASSKLKSGAPESPRAMALLLEHISNFVIAGVRRDPDFQQHSAVLEV